MFREICLTNFRGVDSKCIRLGQVTLIYGPPDSGKTTFMEALALLMQSRGEQWLTLEGPLLIIHEPEDIHQGGDLEKPFVIEFTVRMELGEVTYGYKYATATSYVEQWLALDGVKLVHLAKRNGGGSLTYPMEVPLCTAPYAVINEDVLITCSAVEDERVKKAERTLFDLRVGLRDKFYFISSRRLAAWKYTYETHVDLMPATAVGPEGQFVPHHLSKILSQPQYHRLREELYKYLPVTGVEDVRVGFVKSGRIGMYVKSRHWTNAYNAGLYTKSVFSIVLQLLLATEGSAVFIDDVDLGVSSRHFQHLLQAMLEIAQRRRLQLVLTAREPAFRNVAEKYDMHIVEL